MTNPDTVMVELPRGLAEFIAENCVSPIPEHYEDWMTRTGDACRRALAEPPASRREGEPATTAQPVSPDLVDAARGMLVAYHGITYAGFGDRTLDDWNRLHAAADTLTAAAGLSTREVFEAAEANHAAALQNTPEVDQ